MTAEPFDAVDVIVAKRDGARLTDPQIDWVVDAYTRGVVADEQMSALAMAILLNGMSRGEIARWTAAMIASGERLDFSGLGRPTAAFVWMMIVAVFVSLPFSTYALLAGRQGIPEDVYEAARVDGAGRARTYFRITLPLLRPSLLVAAIINVINVFNSFPIIWAMTAGGPGHATDTTTTFMYKLAFYDQHVGESAAMAVVNFVLILVMVLVYLRATRWREEVR